MLFAIPFGHSVIVKISDMATAGDAAQSNMIGPNSATVALCDMALTRARPLGTPNKYGDWRRNINIRDDVSF